MPPVIMMKLSIVFALPDGLPSISFSLPWLFSTVSMGLGYISESVGGVQGQTTFPDKSLWFAGLILFGIGLYILIWFTTKNQRVVGMKH